MEYLDLSGLWQCEIPGVRADIRIPGTLDESRIGYPDDPAAQWKAEELKARGLLRDGDPIVTRLTRQYVYEGPARIFRRFSWQKPDHTRVFAEVERARQLRLFVNGREAPPYRPGSLSTPWIFEITGLATGEDEICFLSDNSYPGWPRDAIVYSSAASDETQTNWNGLLGHVRLRLEKEAFLSAVRVYPKGNAIDVRIELDAPEGWAGTIRLRSEALRGGGAEITEGRSCGLGQSELSYTGLPLRDGVKKWDLEEGNLFALTVQCEGMEEKTVSFGVRDFEARDGHLTLNSRRVFLRSEANCAVFPETGCEPMTEAEWTAVLEKYRAYGVNCMRFHSHCPPDAAFTAADRLGMLMQPELNHWNPTDAFSSPESQAYYRTELRETLRFLANHPSFVMLTFGNELAADPAGHAFMDELLAEARKDPTRLYANGSNPHYGGLGPDPASDFYTSTDCPGHHLRATSAEFRGWLNQKYPDFRTNYEDGMAAIREKSDQPVFTFEVGQYEVLPDFGQIDDYRGVTRPDSLRFFRDKMKKAGFEADWERRVAATGELSLLCYRAEVEAALRTAGYSGISLLGLQDFPGQGVALVGMMDAHLQPKPYDFARPERFRAFFRDALPLALLPRFTYTAGETLQSDVRLANYGKTPYFGALRWSLEGVDVSLSGQLSPVAAPNGGLTGLGTLSVRLPELTRPEKLTLKLSFADTENAYPLWVYPDETPVRPESVHECRVLDDQALSVLSGGGSVFLAPDADEKTLPASIPTQFSTDFWSVCTFPTQAGGMGMLIDEEHPLFRLFPTDSHTDWQWWPMAVQRAFLLPGPMDAVIAEMDSCALLRPMAKLLECRCGGGKLMVSSLNLHHLTRYPEARALLRAIYAYMASEDFKPRQQASVAWARSVAVSAP